MTNALDHPVGLDKLWQLPRHLGLGLGLTVDAAGYDANNDGRPGLDDSAASGDTDQAAAVTAAKVGVVYTVQPQLKAENAGTNARKDAVGHGRQVHDALDLVAQQAGGQRTCEQHSNGLTEF